MFNAAVAGEAPDATAGGFARTAEGARLAAIGEALERYCGQMARLPLRDRAALAGATVLDARDFALFTDEQRRRPGFAWPPAEPRFTQVFSLADNQEAWVPEELVGLGSRGRPTLPSTSSGLAAHRTPARALTSAVEELLERDALAVTWLNGLPGRELVLPPTYTDEVLARGGEVRAFDLTQRWNPHPVVAVAGQLPLRGLRRYALGCACRADAPAALEKAWLEWLQGVIFAGYWLSEHPDLAFAAPTDVRDFPDHGVYYALRPDEWARVPLLRAAGPARPLPPASPGSLESLVRALGAAGIRLYYRDLTLPDVADLDVTVVRAISPELSLLHGDEQAPFLGGRTRDPAWRYPELTPPGPFPNPLPHPLG